MSKGGAPDPKMSVTEYRMAVHMGVCQGPVDRVKRIFIGEKVASSTAVSETTGIDIDKRNLFGGEKKEGGAVGKIWALFGDAAQTIPNDIAARLGRTGATCPGFRGLLSLFFVRVAGGFEWGNNTPYLKPVWIEAERAAGLDWYAETARIYRELPKRLSLYMSIDRSGSMDTERVAAVKAGMDRVFDFLETAISEFGVEIDVAVQFWGVGRTEQAHVSATLADIGSLRSYVANWNSWSGGTDFTQAATGAVDWFTATAASGDIEKRIWIFLTDGEPDTGTDDTAAGIAADLLDRSSGSFTTAAGTAVDCHGVNLVHGETSATAKLDNTPQDGVPVITATQSSALTAIIVSALGVGHVDANPAHMIRECLLDTNWGMGGAPASLDDDSFRDAADTLFAERFGLTMVWSQQTEIEAFVGEVLDHIEAQLFLHPRTGLLTLKLIRGDYDVGSLPTVSPANATLSNFQRKGWGETVNEVVVSFTEHESGKAETVGAQDLASVSIQGIVSDTRNYYGVRRKALARQLANRDLRAAAAPLATCDAELDRTMWDLVPGDVVKLSWPEYGIQQIVMRVGPADYGAPGNSRIKVSLVEDVFGLDAGDFDAAPDSEWVDPSEEPGVIDHYEVLTLPYWTVARLLGATSAASIEHPESAVGVLAAQGGADTSQYNLETPVTDASGATGYRRVATRSVLARMELAGAIDAEAATVLTIAGQTQGASPETGGFAFIGAGGDGAVEMALVTAFDAETSAVTIDRGVLDTVPRAWPVSTPVWFLNANQPWHDPTERAAGETAEYKIRPRTSLGLLDRADAAVIEFTVGERPHLPSRPADVKVNGTGWGEVDSIDTDPVTVTVAERNRLTEDSQILGWTDATVTPESGQTWKVELLDPADRSVIATVSGLTGTSTTIAHSVFAGHQSAILRVTADRDTFESLQGHEITVLVSGITADTDLHTADTDLLTADH